MNKRTLRKKVVGLPLLPFYENSGWANDNSGNVDVSSSNDFSMSSNWI